MALFQERIRESFNSILWRNTKNNFGVALDRRICNGAG
jgi:hypothetical protein